MRTSIIVFFILLLTNVPLKMTGTLDSELHEEMKQKAEDAWVENRFSELSLEEKIGQLIMIRAHSNKGASHEAEVLRTIDKYKVGGVIFFQGTPTKQAQLTNRYQAKSKIPLMVAIDGEWGLGMRMKSSTISYPRQLMLGAIKDNRVIYDMGREIARQCKRIGIHVNFAPVVDVNNNPNNPVINDRSFGEDRQNVAAKSYMYMKGMQDGGVMACAKHFPGHGDTDVDSHYDLPVITHSRSRLDSVELYPFKILAQHGLQSMMIAHLSIPSLDNRANLPSSLSDKIIENLLRQEMGYDGLIFTDGLEMQGVRKYFTPGEIAVKALAAGNDILLLPPSVPASVTAVKKALDNGQLSRSKFEEKVRKVLRSKFRLGLHSYTPINISGINADLNSTGAKDMKRRLTEASLTMVRNDDNVLPIRASNSSKIATLSIGKGHQTTFQKALSRQATIKHYSAGRSVSSSLLNSLKRKEAVIVSFHGMSKSAKKGYGISSSAKNFVKKLSKYTKVVVVLFGSPYSAKYFDDIKNVVVAYDSDKMTEEAAAKGILGAITMNGKLPVTASPKSRFGAGLNTDDAMTLQYGSPESVGMSSNVLAGIDKIAQEAINIHATPSAQVLVAKNNKIVYHKAYGHHTYDRHLSTQKSDIFDMASVTKICASTIAVMKLVDEGKVNINSTLGQYIPALRGTNKANLVIKEVMAHRARLQAWIPFYKETVMGQGAYPVYKPNIYKNVMTEEFNVPVADNLYIKKSYPMTIRQKIYNSPLRSRAGYKYSDLGFYLMRDLVEAVSGMSFDKYVQTTFYEPMGLEAAGFNPWKRFDKSRIIPTERDDYFRNQEVHGYVHDMGSAMMGGVSGHAGLFATGKDIAVIMQMLLNGGTYGGKQYLKPSTINLFTKRHPNSTRRGIGFDMKELSSKRSKNMSPLASSQAFGHMGFTGICVWSDPKHDLTYIFFSNRTYPSMTNKKLITADIRPRIQSVVYKAMK